MNGRVEVPALVDDDIAIVNSADIVAYLELLSTEAYLSRTRPPLASTPAPGNRAADTFIDPILIDISYWKWADRPDRMPDGLLEAARARPPARVRRALLGARASRICERSHSSIADIALFPHLASAKAMQVEFSAEAHPNLARWFKEMRSLPICAADLQRARHYLAHMQ